MQYNADVPKFLIKQARKGFLPKCEMGVLWNLSLKQVQTLMGSITFVLQIIVNRIGLDKKQ